MESVEPEGSFPRFAGGFPSELGENSSLGGSNLDGPFGRTWLADIRIRTVPRSWPDHDF